MAGPSAIDLHVGKKLLRRRRQEGHTQQGLAEMVGASFQQIQKYECAQNRISIEMLYKLSKALHVPIGYFFEGFDDGSATVNSADPGVADNLPERELNELAKVYSTLGARSRRQLLKLAKTLENESDRNQ